MYPFNDNQHFAIADEPNSISVVDKLTGVTITLPAMVLIEMTVELIKLYDDPEKTVESFSIVENDLEGGPRIEVSFEDFRAFNHQLNEAVVEVIVGAASRPRERKELDLGIYAEDLEQISGGNHKEDQEEGMLYGVSFRGPKGQTRWIDIEPAGVHSMLATIHAHDVFEAAEASRAADAAKADEPESETETAAAE